MYQSREIVSQGKINLGTWGSRDIRTGTHRFGTSRHPTVFLLCLWQLGAYLPQLTGWWEGTNFYSRINGRSHLIILIPFCLMICFLLVKAKHILKRYCPLKYFLQLLYTLFSAKNPSIQCAPAWDIWTLDFQYFQFYITILASSDSVTTTILHPTFLLTLPYIFFKC